MIQILRWHTPRYRDCVYIMTNGISISNWIQFRISIRFVLERHYAGWLMSTLPQPLLEKLSNFPFSIQREILIACMTKLIAWISIYSIEYLHVIYYRMNLAVDSMPNLKKWIICFAQTHTHTCRFAEMYQFNGSTSRIITNIKAAFSASLYKLTVFPILPVTSCYLYVCHRIQNTNPIIRLFGLA